MQNVVLGVFVFNLTNSPSFTTFVIFVQLFPLLALSIVGGSLADTVDRKKLLIATQAWQAGWGFFLAYHVIDGDISRPLLLLIVFMTGIGQALYAPAFTAIVPSLVGRKNLSAAISLNSAQVNGSRIIGPVIGTYLATTIGIAEVFAINAATYILIIGALASVTMPEIARSTLGTRDRLLSGLRLARKSPQVGRPLLTMVLFSLLCLPFIGLMPIVAELNWGIESESQTYGRIYSVFGIGAFVGALAVGTVLLRADKPTVIRWTLLGFGISMGVMSLLRSHELVYPVIFFVGLFYFTMPTALSTFLQEHLADEIRGRVMALWVISFGGIISITNLLSGALVEATSVSTVLSGSAVAAIAIGLGVRLTPGELVDESLLDDTPATPHADPVDGADTPLTGPVAAAGTPLIGPARSATES